VVSKKKIWNDLTMEAAVNFVTFNEDEKVNIVIMDDEHEETAKLINHIYSAFCKKNNKSIVSHLESLLKLLRKHFDYEERMMKETKFSGYISHKLEHDRVYNKLNAFFKSYLDGKPTLTLDDMNNMKSWFHNHIELSDKKCGSHFVAQGIK
jgi:hemerythrin